MSCTGNSLDAYLKVTPFQTLQGKRLLNLMSLPLLYQRQLQCHKAYGGISPKGIRSLDLKLDE